MSPTEGETDSSQLEVPLPSTTSQLSSISIVAEYFAQPQIPNEQRAERLSGTDLPASFALPLASTRSSTPTTASPLRAEPSVSVDDDSVSVRSFVPTLAVGDDLETMLSEMLGSDTRWRTDQDDDIDVWESQSEGDSDSDMDSSEEPEDDGCLC